MNIRPLTLKDINKLIGRTMRQAQLHHGNAAWSLGNAIKALNAAKRNIVQRNASGANHWLSVALFWVSSARSWKQYQAI